MNRLSHTTLASLIAAAGLCTASLVFTSALHASPILNIAPLPFNQTIPNPWNYDPHADIGIACINQSTGTRDLLPREFHDRNNGRGAIRGHVTALGSTSSGYFNSFEITAYVTNDSPGPFPISYPGTTNAQGEFRRDIGPVLGAAPSYATTMRSVLICAEFAGVTNYFNEDVVRQSGVSSTNLFRAIPGTHSHAMYYFKGSHAGYIVPAWSLGDITPGQTKSVVMKFSIKGGVLKSSSLGTQLQSWLVGPGKPLIDILGNRPDALKIYDWPVETLSRDQDGSIGSRVSVFHK
jgi:hypothetical protein